MNIKVEKFLKFSWLILFPFIGTFSVKAAEWSVGANVNQNISYDDNVKMRENDKKDSLIYKVSPSVEFAHKTDISEISLNANYGFEHFFSNISDQDSTLDKNRHSQIYGFKGRYAMTERLDWGLSSDFSIAPSRDIANQESGIFDTDSDRTAFSILPSVTYQLTEQDSLELFAGYTDTSYSDIDVPKSPELNTGSNIEINEIVSRSIPPSGGGSNALVISDSDSERWNNWLSGSLQDGILSDFESKNIGLKWSRSWSERLNGSLRFSYSTYESERITPEIKDVKIFVGEDNVESKFNTTSFSGNTELIESDTYDVTVSSSYMLFENWEVYGEVGGRYTLTETKNNITPDEDGDDFGFLFDVGTVYTGENLSADFSIGQEETPSPRGDKEERLSVDLDLNYSITERLSTALVSRYQRSKRKGSSEDSERTNINIQPSLTWMLSPDWAVSTSYRFQYQKRPIAGLVEKAYSNLYMISLNYRWQGLSISR